TAQGPQPLGCQNIDFEGGDTSTWSVIGDFQVMSGGTDPYGGFPRVYPGGTNSLRLNDDNITLSGPNKKVNFKASATRIIPVTNINNQFQLHFAFCILNYPHPANAAALFQVRFYDQFNNVLTCPTYSCYYSNPPAPGSFSGLPPGVAQTSPITGKNIGLQTYPVTYVPWQTVSMDLSAYNGTNVKVVIDCNWCIYNYDWGYCYIDADCGSNTFLPSGVACGGSLCGPPGMASYTWTPPAGAATTNSCITATGPGIYTLQCTPFLVCSPVKTYTVFAGNNPPTITVTPQQPTCTNSISTATATTSGANTASGYTLTWAPPPSTVTPITMGSIGSGLVPGMNTITVTDVNGCQGSTTFSMNAPPPIPSFSIQAPFGTVVGCNPSTITLNAINTNTVLTNMTYTWTSTSTGTQTGVSIPGQAPSGPNTYTVFGSDITNGGCVAIQTITVTQNLITPSVNVTPLTATINCNGLPKTFTATCTTPTANIFGNWYDPTGTPMGSPSGSLIPMTTGNCGIYSVTYTNVVNGCTTTKQVTVTCDPTVPTMTVNALDGFVISCLKPCLKFNISASVGPAPKTYSWTNLSTSVTTVPASGGYTICTPGNYLAEYQDGNMCRISQQITVSIDTLRPSPTATTTLAGGSFTLSCFQPSLVATAVTTPMLPIGNYSWTVPPNLTITTPTLAIDQSSVTTSGTTYTVLATGTNGCVGKQKIIFYKDIFVPPYTAVFTPSAITCANPSVALSPQSTSTSTIPVTFTFTSPPPTTTANASGSLFNIPGTYTMTYQSLLNGCTAVTTTVVPLNVTPPATLVVQPAGILCGSNTTTITAGTTTQPNYYIYSWQPPVGAGMSCASCYSSSVNTPGNYYVTITNTVNGCVTTNSVYVTSSPTLPVSFSANPASGFAPLTVGFNNTTVLGSATSGTVTTSWSYGNGSAYTFTNISSGGTPNGGTTYEAPGSYTVMLVVMQAIGSSTCVGTATTVVNVDIPSELVIPNVFTPNGDGINDMFTVQSTNISDINCVIFDRWGVKMYDVTSDKGQIGWDGKNLFGKEVPTGTYFFILKATGKDGQSFEKKGTVNLYK
ncbi:MAG: T9SS type B sorting domain-containing protein, partial [Bacteroidia bacterium]